MTEMRQTPTYCVSWVCSHLTNPAPQSGSAGTSAEAIFVQTIPGSKMPAPCFHDLLLQETRAGQRWHGGHSAGKQQGPAGARATTSVTGSLVPATALLESIS